MLFIRSPQGLDVKSRLYAPKIGDSPPRPCPSPTSYIIQPATFLFLERRNTADSRTEQPRAALCALHASAREGTRPSHERRRPFEPKYTLHGCRFLPPAQYKVPSLLFDKPLGSSHPAPSFGQCFGSWGCGCGERAEAAAVGSERRLRLWGASGGCGCGERGLINGLLAG